MEKFFWRKENLSTNSSVRYLLFLLLELLIYECDQEFFTAKYFIRSLDFAAFLSVR